LNKFTIPAILVVTVLVAGIFAFMPVEKASTVHTTIQSATQADTQTTTLQANINKQDRLLTFPFMTGLKNLNTTTAANILPFKDEAWTGNVTVIVSDGFATCGTNTVDGGVGGNDGSENPTATVQGIGQNTSSFTTIDRLEAIVDAGMECTIIVFLDETIE